MRTWFSLKTLKYISSLLLGQFETGGVDLIHKNGMSSTKPGLFKTSSINLFLICFTMYKAVVSSCSYVSS